MNEEQRTTSERPATDRAEEMLGRLGQRFTDMRTNVGRALEERARQQAKARANGGSGDARSASGRAEDTLTDWGERVGYFAGTAGLRLRQWGARAREEAEDLWAEAQTMRQQGASGGQSATDTAARTTAGQEEAASEKAASSSNELGQRPEQMDESAQPS